MSAYLIIINLVMQLTSGIISSTFLGPFVMSDGLFRFTGRNHNLVSEWRLTDNNEINRCYCPTLSDLTIPRPLRID